MDNSSLFFFIFNLSRQSLVLDQIMIYFTRYFIYLTILFAFILGFKGGIKEKKAFLIILIGIPLAILIIKTLHLFVFEPRPYMTFPIIPIAPEKMDASFPSRHATIAAVLAFAHTYFKTKWSLALLLIMLLIGFSRIYVGVHYPLDVIGGFITGALAVLISLQIKKLLKISFFS